MASIVDQVEEWFLKHGRQISLSFPTLRFNLMHGSDPVRGKVSIQVDGPAAQA